MISIVELLEYWIEEPPAHVTLALRYLGERKPKAMTENEARGKMQEIAGMLGCGVQAVSDRTRELVAYAEEMKTKMCRTKHGR